jgi:hypothetical protein
MSGGYSSPKNIRAHPRDPRFRISLEMSQRVFVPFQKTDKPVDEFSMRPLKFSSANNRNIGRSSIFAPREQAGPNVGKIALPCVNFPANFRGPSLPLGKIAFNFCPVPQIVRDRRIGLAQREAGVSLHNGFGRQTILKTVNDDFQKHARLTDTQGAGRIAAQGGCVGVNYGSHLDRIPLEKEKLSARPSGREAASALSKITLQTCEKSITRPPNAALVVPDPPLPKLTITRVHGQITSAPHGALPIIDARQGQPGDRASPRATPRR